MPWMLRLLIVLVAAGLLLAGEAAFAQGVAPGGGIGNSTGIGSGLGGVIGTGPSYPNGTTQPSLPPPPPPGGYGGPTSSPPPASSTARPSYYPQPREPFDATTPRPAAAALSLPEQQTNDLSFLKGCWRTDVFQYERHPGTSTWCFDEKGAGRFLFTRQDQPGYFCRGPAQAAYAGQALRLHDVKTDCSDANDKGPGDLDCHPSGEAAQCSAAGSNQVVHLYRVR
jgi:hypothetical protein